ncbi:hypothetical protein NB688_001622 [Xanthomonas sacchari]|uniref:Uncharacterized protein n=1 Tax=Xanthomonas sacchari TaxID=56458 RepID=A0ABT3DSA2_9XANT|nr:hypothetical protein [Xanthomonas sacchari]MCW0419456.1 hypothetical protein [Xanthomonas sacchari]
MVRSGKRLRAAGHGAEPACALWAHRHGTDRWSPPARRRHWRWRRCAGVGRSQRSGDHPACGSAGRRQRKLAPAGRWPCGVAVVAERPAHRQRCRVRSARGCVSSVCGQHRRYARRATARRQRAGAGGSRRRADRAARAALLASAAHAHVVRAHRHPGRSGGARRGTHRACGAGASAVRAAASGLVPGFPLHPDGRRCARRIGRCRAVDRPGFPHRRLRQQRTAGGARSGRAGRGGRCTQRADDRCRHAGVLCQ